MKKTLIKILEILTKKDKKNIFLSVIFLLTKSVLEVIGIGLIIPILNFAVSENNQSILNEYIPFLNNLTNKESIVFFVLIFIFIYFVKTAFALFYSTWSNRFVNNLSVDLTLRVLERYLGKDYIFFLENNSAYLIRNISSETGLFAPRSPGPGNWPSLRWPRSGRELPATCHPAWSTETGEWRGRLRRHRRSECGHRSSSPVAA